MITDGPLEFEPLHHVAANMRAKDAEEVFATCWRDDPAQLANCLIALPGDGVVFKLDDVPACAMGAAQMRPGVFSMWMFGTDDFPKVKFYVQKYSKRVIIPALVAAGCHRAECQSLASHTEAHDWLTRSFGAKKEAVLEGFGKNGETFFQFARLFPNVRFQPSEE